MIIDTHSHYNLDPLVLDWQKHWNDAQQHTVTKSIVIGTSAESSKIAVNLSNQNQAWKVAVGIHPHEKFDLADMKAIEELISDKNVIAIGECGLDYFRFEDELNKEEVISSQRNMLKAQIILAKKHQLPLVIHLRDTGETAYWDFLSLYKEYGATATPFILHCVSGPIAFVQQAIELGAYIGVAGNVTYKNADHIRQIVKSVPTDRVLLETDAPFLPPTPHRGAVCEPWMIQLTQKFLADELQINEETLFTNTVRLFPQFI
jgi:TatD DNase family protein